MIKRTDYLNELNKWKDEQVIKVVTGIRRCGKSSSKRSLSVTVYPVSRLLR